MRIVGLDLAGKESNETGFCLFEGSGKGIAAKSLLDDREILREVERANPDVVAVDAPLSLPKEGYFRPCDLLMKKRGFNVLSPVFPGMKILTLRAMMIARFVSRHSKVIEVFPRATERILGLSRGQGNEHEYDALLCALTGKKFLEGSYEDLEGIIIPA